MKLSGLRLSVVTGALVAVASLCGCRSPHVEINVQNETGAPVHLLEVDYPSASFGKDVLDAGANYHYRIQVQGSGPLAVTWTTPKNAQPHVTGPTLADRQHGSVEIILLPNGKAEFHQQISSLH